MDGFINTIQQGDCIELLNSLPEGSVDLAFADPPFNIGYEYDVYDDRLEDEKYLDWSEQWIKAVHRVLKDDGTFWLAIGDEYAAELKVASKKIGFHCRSWVIWYYTFGVNCKNKFSRSHAHLFHFVKDPENFTFRSDEMENRIPSARQLVYNDKRANPRGRLADDTWIIPPADSSGIMGAQEEDWNPPVDDGQTFQLRPQDLEQRFRDHEDTWYFPRVAGTFKERAGFHGCQMPEQLLGRIIKFCSHPDELVLDPFSGSATTVAVAKKLGRNYIGFDISEDYVNHGLQRLSSITAGDRLDGSPEPLMSVPSTAEARNRTAKKKAGRKAQTTAQVSLFNQPEAAPPTKPERMSADEVTSRPPSKLDIDSGIKTAFINSYEGFSADRVVADPDLNKAFVDQCEQLGLDGEPKLWNTRLFSIRKRGGLADVPASRTTMMPWKHCDPFLFAVEIAIRQLLDQGAGSVDEILCDPVRAAAFDQEAQRFAPSVTPFEFRWGALKLRKESRKAILRSESLKLPSKLGRKLKLEDALENPQCDGQGVYLLTTDTGKQLYVGSSLNILGRLRFQFGAEMLATWTSFAPRLTVQTHSVDGSQSDLFGYHSGLARRWKPKLNVLEL